MSLHQVALNQEAYNLLIEKLEQQSALYESENARLESELEGSIQQRLELLDEREAVLNDIAHSLKEKAELLSEQEALWDTFSNALRETPDLPASDRLKAIRKLCS